MLFKREHQVLNTVPQQNANNKWQIIRSSMAVRDFLHTFFYNNKLKIIINYTLGMQPCTLYILSSFFFVSSLHVC